MTTMRTVSGGILDLGHPRVASIELIDIAVGLSHACRFGGQIKSFYSVGQHSLLVRALCPGDLRAHALVHDATEAYIGDVTRQFKHSKGMSGYRRTEKRLNKVILKRFGLKELDRTERYTLKVADDLAACLEYSFLIDGEPLTYTALLDLVQRKFVKIDVNTLWSRFTVYGKPWNVSAKFEPRDTYLVTDQLLTRMKEII